MRSAQVVAALMVKRVAILPANRHIYLYGPDESTTRFMTLDLVAGRIYPSTAEGEPLGEAYASEDGESYAQGDLDSRELNIFLRSTVGVFDRVRAGEEPPETAHRFFY